MQVAIVVAAVLLVLIAVVALRPAAYHVERKRAIAAPAEAAFEVLNDLRRFAGVLVLFKEPWDQPGMEKTFAGPSQGVGQSCSWSGKKAGKGTMAIEESVAGRKVRIAFNFIEPMASKASYALAVEAAPSGALATWSISGNHNFLGKAVSLFMDFDKMLGADLEKGIARLEDAAKVGLPK